MDIEQYLLRLGIRTYIYPVVTAVTPKLQVLLGDSLSTELGWIYGISTEIVGVIPDDPATPLPTFVQASNLYLTLLNGQTMYINNFRMSNLVYVDPTAANTNPTSNQRRFFPVNIPMSTDLKNSFYQNPTNLTGFSTVIYFHYIPKKTYLALVAAKKLEQFDLGIL